MTSRHKTKTGNHGSGDLKCREDDWDGLRACLQKFIAWMACKDELSDSDNEVPQPFDKSIDAIEIIENLGEKVWLPV